jgi:hypothetical protein
MHFEAKELSIQSLEYPQMQAAMRARVRQVSDMVRAGLTIQQIRMKIWWMYRRGELKKPWDVVDMVYPKGKKRFAKARKRLRFLRRRKINYKPGVYDEP